ncbi:MAG: 23S rRNA (adenine(2503)-C(2))-methyltransferase RlmN [Oscillospiraceae bacterium]|nr:23S rRNA (adenine(2503)-C(2))-methyltransferase RlmN [Oscillospiraceae bacterium]
MIDILSLTLSELSEQMVPLKQPKYRAKQIFEWLHKKKASSFEEMTDTPAQLRAALKLDFCIKSLNIQKTLVSDRQDTVKYLYGLDDGNKIETVFMSHKHGNSLCISSQVGCKMACCFCASGMAGFIRNLSPSEMLLQLYQTEKQQSPANCSSIVIMGVGEPLDNFDNVIRFLRLLESPDGHNMSLRHVSLSTCGLVERIDELRELKMGLTLSVSLHAVTDSERSAIMPINQRYNIGRLLTSCAEYYKHTGRRISFEYSLINGVNDGTEHADELVRLLSAKMSRGSFHVNLIPINVINEVKFRKSANVKAFAGILEKSGVAVTVRRTMGADINAACGQLRTTSFSD